MSDIVYKRIEIKVLVHTIMFNIVFNQQRKKEKTGADLVRTITS